MLYRYSSINKNKNKKIIKPVVLSLDNIFLLEKCIIFVNYTEKNTIIKSIEKNEEILTDEGFIVLN